MSELGRFHAGFATPEMSLNILLAFAIGKNQAMAEAILERVKNIGDRISIIRGVAAASDELTPRQKHSVELACDKATALNSRRNVYAHGLYEY